MQNPYYILSIFSNREIASGIWLTIFILLVALKKDVRDLFWQLLKVFFSWKIQSALFILIIYSLIIVYGLYCAGFWEKKFIKDSLFWFLLTGIIFPLDFLGHGRKENPFKEALKSSLKLIIILEFILTEYTFSLILEIFLVPISALVVVLYSFSQNNDEYEPARKVFTFLLISLGLINILNSSYFAILDYKYLGTFITVKKILLPPVLTISLAPLVYVFMLVAAYEQLFVYFHFAKSLTAGQKRRAKFRLFLALRFSPQRIEKFRQKYTYLITDSMTDEDLDEYVAQAKS